MKEFKVSQVMYILRHGVHHVEQVVQLAKLHAHQPWSVLALLLDRCLLFTSVRNGQD